MDNIIVTSPGLSLVFPFHFYLFRPPKTKDRLYIIVTSPRLSLVFPFHFFLYRPPKTKDSLGMIEYSLSPRTHTCGLGTTSRSVA